ncbi:MAG: dTDP-4-dehydrorhamnose reductase, partial [Terriglobia bacterium]
MKTILLGPNGQLGSDIYSENLRKGEPLSIKPVDRSVVDLSDLDTASSFLKAQDFECLINCSSYHKTDEVEQNAEHAFRINAHLVRNLAEICADKNARLVHISTDYVFGGQQKREPLTELDDKAPVNVYGASKGMGEDLAMLAGADVLILRVASLFGVAGASGKGGNFVETMIRLGRDKGKLNVVADQTMSPTATADVAAVIVRMLQAGVSSGIWNVVNSNSATWYEFARRIVERAGIPASVVPIATADFPTPAKRPPY